MNDLNKKKKIYAIISAVIVVILTGFLTYFVFVKFKEFGSTPEELRDFINSFGWTGRLVGLGIQALQVVIALIPGEAVEIGLGYAFGAVEGTLICYAGTIIASIFIFFLTRLIGLRFVEIFVPREKIDEVKLINSPDKLRKFVFWSFFIPGIPKDLITYFIGLTRIKLHEFLLISCVARIPSVVSSTIGGSYVGSGDYYTAAIIFAVTGAISIVCILLYNKYKKKKGERQNEEVQKN